MMMLNGIINDTITVMISVYLIATGGSRKLHFLSEVQWVDSFSKLLPLSPADWWCGCRSRYSTLARHVSIFCFAQPLEILAFAISFYWMNYSYLCSTSPIVFRSHITESQNSRGHSGDHLVQRPCWSRFTKTDCTRPSPGGFWISLEKESPLALWAAFSLKINIFFSAFPCKRCSSPLIILMAVCWNPQ